MSFVLPIRPSKAPKTPRAVRTTKKLQAPALSPRRRPSLATRAGVVKRRSSVSTTFNAPSMSFFEAMFGDDFPDTFVHGDGRSCKSKKTLFDLPKEIIEIVCQLLSRSDLKRLRLTNRELAEAVELRIDRVFVSPNRANLDCLNHILNHDRYRVRVQEIVWDDAQLDEYPTLETFRERLDSDETAGRVALKDHLSTLLRGRYDEDTDYDPIGVESCIDEEGTLTQLGKIILANSNDQKSGDIIASYAAAMSIEDSYDLYQKLYQDEKEIIKRGWDALGLQRALTRLPNLNRVTVSSEVWRSWNPIPAYDTPFYRALPVGFRKPSVWPWDGCIQLGSGESPAHDTPSQHLPEKWRGYSIAMALLAANPVQGLQEIMLDTGQERVGLPYELFALPNIDYTNTIQVLSTAPIRRFQISFCEHVAPLQEDSVVQILSDTNLFRYVIGAMPLLEHLDVKWIARATEAPDPLPASLSQICPRLRCLALRYARVTGIWLYNLIVNLKSLENVVLDKIGLLMPEPSTEMTCVEFFSDLRDHYAVSAHRGPSITWNTYLPGDPTANRSIRTYKQSLVVDHELDDFLYDGGEPPWIEGETLGKLKTLNNTVGRIRHGRNH